ncbi:MAG: Nif3-like dinuclear metal center hexameric protein [bacterium]|nr:Nif3-like dinuclear metal center hexameric protein [bacterium]
MKASAVYNFIDKLAPFNTAAGFDNSGFLIGSPDAEVSGIVVALDCTEKAIEKSIATNSNLIVTHHPLIFDPIKKIHSDSIIYKLIQNNISLICAHTNLDYSKGGVNDVLCKRLGINKVKGYFPVGEDSFELRAGELPYTFTADNLARYIKERVGGYVRYSNCQKELKTVAVCSGSGGSMLSNVATLEVDAYISGDIKHSVFLEAEQLGIAIFDAGHFNTEDIIVDPLCAELSVAFPDTNIYPFHFYDVKTV